MEQILVESSKTYSHGFLLREQDIRRLVNLMNEQFAKISTQAVEFIYTLQYSNGAIANTDDIESVLKQENEGSSSIVRLEIQAIQETEGKETAISVYFRDTINDDESGLKPIKHLIIGQSRDWVFVTSSLIEERISKIKKRGFNFNIFKNFAPVILMFIMIIAMFSSTPALTNSSISKNMEKIIEIETKWKAKQITDPIEVILQIEKNRNSDKITTIRVFGDIFLNRNFLLISGTSLLIILFLYFYSKYCPRFNFYWGGYIEKYDRKENIRKFILGFFFVTIILGVIVNLLSDYIWDKI